jgi:hypothetical protein
MGTLVPSASSGNILDKASRLPRVGTGARWPRRRSMAQRAISIGTSIGTLCNQTRTTSPNGVPILPIREGSLGRKWNGIRLGPLRGLCADCHKALDAKNAPPCAGPRRRHAVRAAPSLEGRFIEDECRRRTDRAFRFRYSVVAGVCSPAVRKKNVD